MTSTTKHGKVIGPFTFKDWSLLIKLRKGILFFDKEVRADPTSRVKRVWLWQELDKYARIMGKYDPAHPCIDEFSMR